MNSSGCFDADRLDLANSSRFNRIAVYRVAAANPIAAGSLGFIESLVCQFEEIDGM